MISSINPLPTMLSSYGIPCTTPSNIRRIIRCLIELQRLGEARDYFPKIKETPPHALTCVLQFQVAVRCDDEQLGIRRLSRRQMLTTSHKSFSTIYYSNRICSTNVILLCS